MEFNQALDEGLGKGIATAALILLTTLGLQRQSQTLEVARDFLRENPSYVSVLRDLESKERPNKIERNDIVNQWKQYISSQNLDPRLSRGLKIVGSGELSNYKSGDLR